MQAQNKYELLIDAVIGQETVDWKLVGSGESSFSVLVNSNAKEEVLTFSHKELEEKLGPQHFAAALSFFSSLPWADNLHNWLQQKKATRPV